MIAGQRIEAVDDETGAVLPCRGDLAVDTKGRCGAPLFDNGTCWYCQTAFCELCGLVVRCVDFNFCEEVCRACVARAEEPVGSPAHGASVMELLAHLPLVRVFS
jgi:hypothetical protein